MNLGDPELELIDPTPNVHILFIQFDKMFFGTKLASRAVVRWSKKMYSSAGVCSYEGRGGLCDIALSEPLLKLRPRKDLVETLLHEMIHAYLFVTCRDQDRDGHGPNFQAHMYRINHAAGINISIYHDFHDEVKLYLTHVWRCNGPCQGRRPHFGIVRRTANRPPGPKEFWWECHKRHCGGTFIKIKEPEKPVKKSNAKPPAKPKPNADISKYVTTTKNPVNAPNKPVLKDINAMPGKTKFNGGNTLVITRKEPVYNPQVVKNPPAVFTGDGKTISNTRPRSNSIGVVETVRNVWANKRLPRSSVASCNKDKPNNMPNTKALNNTMCANNTTQNAKKHKASDQIPSPPAKIKKIDDYFKTSATNMLKDLYGQDFHITQSDKNEKLVAVPTASSVNKPADCKPITESKHIVPDNTNLVNCPICNIKISSKDINRHLDECLNKDVIESLCKDGQVQPPPQQSSSHTNKNKLRNIVGNIPVIPAFKGPEKHKIENLLNEKIEANNNLPIIVKVESESNVIKKEVNAAVIDLELYIKQVSHTPLRIASNVATAPLSQQADNKRQLDEMQKELNTDIIDLENDLMQEMEGSNCFCPNDVNKVKAITKKVNYDKHVQKSDKFIVLKEDKREEVDVGYLPSFLDDVACKIETPRIKIEPGTSKDQIGLKCACCGKNIDKPIEEHLDECLAFFTSKDTTPEEGASTSFANETIVIDDDNDDIFDETQTFNATGTKTPCPCCMVMIEEAEMSVHLDQCLSET